MNKTIKTMVIAGLACVALCGTTVAAPAKNGGKPPAPAKQHQQIKAPAKAAPKHQEVKQHAARPHEEPRREVVHKPTPVHHVTPVKAPPPPKPAPLVCVTPPPPPAPAPVVCVALPPKPAQTVIVEEHHDADPIVALGCALIGGIIGAIAG